MTWEERFWKRIQKDHTDCWTWTGARQSNGRGAGLCELPARLSPTGAIKRGVSVRRWLYERQEGPIPEGSYLLPRCRTPWCVNPAHMRPTVPPAERARAAARQGRPLRGSSTRRARARLAYARGEGTRLEIALRFGYSPASCSELFAGITRYPERDSQRRRRRGAAPAKRPPQPPSGPPSGPR